MGKSSHDMLLLQARELTGTIGVSNSSISLGPAIGRTGLCVYSNTSEVCSEAARAQRLKDPLYELGCACTAPQSKLQLHPSTHSLVTPVLHCVYI